MTERSQAQTKPDKLQTELERAGKDLTSLREELAKAEADKLYEVIKLNDDEIAFLPWSCGPTDAVHQPAIPKASRGKDQEKLLVVIL